MTRSFNPFGAYSRPFGLLLFLVAGEMTAAWVVGHYVLGVSTERIFKFADVGIALSIWFLIPLVWLARIAIKLMRRGSDQPLRKIIRILRANRDWLARGLLLTMIQIPLGRAFATLKSSIPAIDNFSWDFTFAAADRLILGTDAWRLSHAVIGQGGTVVIDRAYALWGTYLILLSAWTCFTRNRELQIKAALAYNLVWLVLGSILAVSFASAGPCFFEQVHGDDRFRPLMAILHSADDAQGLLAINAMEFLASNYGEVRLGSGISAMPSLHVGIAMFGVMMVHAYRLPWFARVASIAILAIILLGSVHLGWHYLLDGLVSIPATAMIWVASSKVVDRLSRNRNTSGASE